MERPRDSSLEAAVDRMMEVAKTEGRQNLIMTPEQWKTLVFPYMKSSQINEFIKEIANRAGSINSVDELNKWL